MTNWIEVASKSVYDSDGFTTDYTWYKSESGDKHIMIFGDKDIYEPDDSYADVEFESEDLASKWFDNYYGFDSEEDLEEAVDNKPVTIKVKYEVYDRTPNPQIKTGKVSGKDLYDALTSMFNHVNTYIDDKEDAEEQFKTADDIIRYLEENNGDGCDYIIEIKDINTGEEYFSAYYEEPEDDWDDLGESLHESDEPAATSIEDAQKWVDYDMKKYGEISQKTNTLVKKAGYQIIKDDHGDYEVTAGDYDKKAANKNMIDDAKAKSTAAKHNAKAAKHDLNSKKYSAQGKSYDLKYNKSKSDTSRHISKNSAKIAKDELNANRLKNKKDIEDIKSQIKKANLQKKLARAQATEDLELNEAGKNGKFLVQVFDEGDWHDLSKWSDPRKAIDAGEKAVEAAYQDYRIIDTTTGDTIDIYDYIEEEFDDTFEVTITDDTIDMDSDSTDTDDTLDNNEEDEKDNLNEDINVKEMYDRFLRILNRSKRYEFNGSILELTDYNSGARVSIDLSKLDYDTFAEMFVDDEDSDDELDECKTLKEDIDGSRPYHDDLLAAIEDGFVDYETVAKAALKFMSDDDIKTLCDKNNFNIDPVIDEDTDVKIDTMNVNVDEVKVKNKDIQPDDIDDSFEMREELTPGFLESFKEEGKIKVISAEPSADKEPAGNVADDNIIVDDMDFDDIDDIEIV